MIYEEIEFLKQSNNIEDVFDDDSLAQAIYAWDFLKEEEYISPSVIQRAHKILMLHQKLKPDEKGYFRTVEVMIGGRLGKPSHLVPELIKKWCVQVNNHIKSAPLQSVNHRVEDQIKKDHVDFEVIHPFVDGNGRVGRLLFLWQYDRVGLPVKIIQALTKHEEYYPWFRES